MGRGWPEHGVGSPAECTKLAGGVKALVAGGGSLLGSRKGRGGVWQLQVLKAEVEAEGSVRQAAGAHSRKVPSLLHRGLWPRGGRWKRRLRRSRGLWFGEPQVLMRRRRHILPRDVSEGGGWRQASERGEEHAGACPDHCSGFGYRGQASEQVTCGGGTV